MKEKAKVSSTILMVDDDEEIRGELKRLLEKQGYHVVLAFDERDSMRLIGDKNLNIGLILIDQRMLSDEALAAGRRIRQHENVSESIPVVVIPFEFSREVEGTNERAGGSDYKSYMANGSQLEDLLTRLLSPKE
jgi:PleD family two-component response regulator